jgi:hypothetical protein
MLNSMSTALLIFGVYLAVGLIVGVSFALRGVDRVDPVVTGSPIMFRTVILPGCVALWPVVCWKWWSATQRRSA